MHLRAMQQAIDRRLSGGYWHPLANLARLSEEVGELAREIQNGWGARRRKPGEPQGEAAHEMGDILFVLAALANTTGVDLEQALRGAMERFDAREAAARSG